MALQQLGSFVVTKFLFMRIGITAIFLVLLAAQSGCVTDRELLKTYRRSSVYNGFGQGISLNGTYRFADSVHGRSLSRDLWQCYSRKDYRADMPAVDSVAVRLVYDGHRRLQVNALMRDGSLATFALKVKAKSRFLSVHHKLFLIPVPFCYFHTEHKAILITDNSGRLVCVHGYDGGGWLLFMVAGTDGVETSASAYQKQQE